MPQKKYKVEEIIGKLREAEILSSQGMDLDEVRRKIEVTEIRPIRTARALHNSEE